MIDTSTYTIISSIPLGNSPIAYGNFIGCFPITISGNVKQDNIGLSGVTITLDGEGILRTKQTTAAGDFIFGLKAGNYQLTPTLSNLAFSPESMDLQVSENKTGLDFVVTGVHPLPTVEFLASKTYVKTGETVTLTWSTNDAQYVVLLIEGYTYQKPANGTINQIMTKTLVFGATACGKGGAAKAKVKVFVGSKPTQLTLAASPSAIAPGDQTTLT